MRSTGVAKILFLLSKTRGLRRIDIGQRSAASTEATRLLRCADVALAGWVGERYSIRRDGDCTTCQPTSTSQSPTD